MINAEVVFDGDLIYINGKLVEFIMGARSDYWQIEDVPRTFSTLEKAVKYQVEQEDV